MYLILSPKVEPNDLSDRTDMLEQVRVDYTDLLQFTLQHWPLLEGSGPTSDELWAAAEAYLTANHAIHRLIDYAHMQQIVLTIVEAVQMFYEGLTGQLTPLLENTPYGVDLTLRLSRYSAKDIVVHLEKPLYGP